jgi:parallel beta-helix repeat protein
MKSRNPLMTPALLACVIAAGVLATPAIASAATYYVATNGNDSNSGTLDAPWRSLRQAVSRLSPGDTLYIRGGVYSSSHDNVDSQAMSVPSGTSWSTPITISGYPGETVTLRPPNGNAGLRLSVGAPHYLVFQDFAIDMSLQSDPTVGGQIPYDAVEAVYVGNGAHHIRFQRLDIGYTMSHAIQWSTNGVGNPFSSYLELHDSTIHHAGAATGDSGHGGRGINNGYGIYTFTDDNLLSGNVFYSNYGIAINAYGSRNTVRNNTIRGNGTRGGPAPAINIGAVSYPLNSSDNLIYNNVIYDNPGGIQIYTNAVRTGVFNNTVFRNAPFPGISVQYYGAGTIIRNNIIYANSTNYQDSGGFAAAPQFDHNLTADPLFVNIGAYDFRLQAISPAIDGGLYVAEITSDASGQQRPQGRAFDIGAFEHGPPEAPADPPRPPQNVRILSR